MRLAIGIALVLAAILIGIGGYQAGLAAGLAQSGGAAPAVAYYAHPFAYGFGFFGFLGPLLFLLLIFLLIRGLFWRGGGPGYWGGRHWYRDRGAMFEEWHRRQHGEEPKAGDTTGGATRV